MKYKVRGAIEFIGGMAIILFTINNVAGLSNITFDSPYHYKEFTMTLFLFLANLILGIGGGITAAYGWGSIWSD